MKALSPLEIYPFLPENSEEIFETSKMALALKLINREISLKNIKDKLIQAGTSKKSYEELENLLSPAIREVVIGVGENAVTIGGDDVLFRHNKTFYNKTPIAISITDLMKEDEIVNLVKEIVSFQKFYIGKTMNIEMIAVLCKSGDPDIYENAIKIVNDTLNQVLNDLKNEEKKEENNSFPIILCSKNPEAIRKALLIVGDKRPLIYGADSENWKSMAELSLEFNVPVTICGNGNLDLLQSIAVTFEYNGISDIVLDPGFDDTKDGFRNTFQSYVSLRISGINGDTLINYPTLFFANENTETENKKLTVFSSIPEFLLPENKDIESSMFETIYASVLTVRYADLLILKHFYPHEFLPLMHLADTMYTDPRVPVSVKSGLYEIGNPNEDSPVLFTTNFALTFYTVESDLSSQETDCYLIAVNTGGLGVEAAAAGGQLTAEVVKKEFEEAGFDISKTSHNTIIIPGLAARIQGELEKITGAKVLVGPMDSGKLAQWIDSNFYKKELNGKTVLLK